MRHGLVLALALVALPASTALGREPSDGGPGLPPPAAQPDPAPYVAPPPDIYYVTDTYVADTVTSAGIVTRYATVTVHLATGSYARVLDVVASGEPSAYDGSSFNRRLTLTDGRPVAGTYYQNYVLADGVFVPVSIVFFQDDAELGDRKGADTALPNLGAVRAEITLAPDGPALASVEVLRGRPVTLWLRTLSDDLPLPVTWWRLVSGDPGTAVVLSGADGTPFRSAWDRLPPPGESNVLVFEIAAGDAMVRAAIAVSVRSPALEL